MEIEAMGNHTTEHAPKSLEAIAGTEREIAAAESRVFALLVARAHVLLPEYEAAEGVDGEVGGKRGGRA